MSGAERPSTAGERGPAWSATADLWDRALGAPRRTGSRGDRGAGRGRPGDAVARHGLRHRRAVRLAAERGATVSGIDARRGHDRARARPARRRGPAGRERSRACPGTTTASTSSGASTRFSSPPSGSPASARRAGWRGPAVWSRSACGGRAGRNDLQGCSTPCSALAPSGRRGATSDPRAALRRSGRARGPGDRGRADGARDGRGATVPYEIADAPTLWCGRCEFDVELHDLGSPSRRRGRRFGARSVEPPPPSRRRRRLLPLSQPLPLAARRGLSGSVDEQAHDRDRADDHDQHPQRGRRQAAAVARPEHAADDRARGDQAGDAPVDVAAKTKISPAVRLLSPASTFLSPLRR